MSKLQEYTHFIETDYTRFDRHISEPFLRDVQDTLLTAPFSQDEHPDLYTALAAARRTSGVSDYGIRYNVDGTRCSGDAHTSIGNGLINLFNTWLCLRTIDPHDWTSIHEGDDGIIALRNGTHDQAMLNLTVLNCLGFSVKSELFKNLDDASFCGRHFYTDYLGVHTHCDALRSLDKFHTTVSNMRPLPLIWAKALSYYHTDGDTPIIGPLCASLINTIGPTLSFSQKKRAAFQMSTARVGRWSTQDITLRVVDHVTPLVPSVGARVSVMRRTGIAIHEQIALERAYSEMHKCGGIIEFPKIPREWILREDAVVIGDVQNWVL
jgi:hypothetical protein